MKKRSVLLVDGTGMIELTLWNVHAQAIDKEFGGLGGNPVIAIRGARVTRFGGRSLTAPATGIEVSPADYREMSDQLTEWWVRGGKYSKIPILTHHTSPEIAPVKTLDQVKQNHASTSFSTTVWITRVPHTTSNPPWYLSCPDDQENFKVSPTVNGHYFCPRNGKTYSSYQPTFILQMQCMDHTGQQWMSCLGNTADSLLGSGCAEVKSLLDQGLHEKFDSVFDGVTWKRVWLKCRVRQNETRVRVNVVDWNEVDFVAQSQAMIDKIHRMRQQ